MRSKSNNSLNARNSGRLVSINPGGSGGWTTRDNLARYRASVAEHAARRAAGIAPRGPGTRYP